MNNDPELILAYLEVRNELINRANVIVRSGLETSNGLDAEQVCLNIAAILVDDMFQMMIPGRVGL